MKKLIIPILGLVVGLSTISCNNTSSSKENGENYDHAAMSHAENRDHGAMGHAEDHHSSENMATTAQLVDYYLMIKDALVSGSQEAAAAAGSKLATAATNFDLSSLTEAEQQNGKEILEVIKENGEHIAKSEMEYQIEHFEAIDTEFIDLLNIAGYDKTLYQQYCPMYNDNEGGTWLSDSEEIENPLFKSKMLTCGSIKRTIAQK
jgi:hypothetical protein